MLARWILARERYAAERHTNRIVRPFEWGASFIREHINGDDPDEIFRLHTQEVMARSEDFYALSPISDFALKDDVLTWTSAVRSSSPENNRARARFFPARQQSGGFQSRRAVVILPEWNAQRESHVTLARVLNHLGISALRLTLPFHEERRPPELERADYLVSPNIGRTIQSVRQAVLDGRAAVSWFVSQGYDRIGIMGTSLGSCTAFLAYAHDDRIDMGVFNHVSGYFADPVWRGISTRHVREGFGDALTLDALREYWLPISPIPFIPRLMTMRARPTRFIAARYDLTFPVDLSREVIAEARRCGLRLDVTWLPCGHYTAGQKPWVYLAGWKIASFFKKHL